MSRPTASLPVDSELASGRRRQKVLRGTGMVTPRQPLVQTENGRSEDLLPGKARFSRSYPLVREHPEWFVPCDPEDAETIQHHRELAERKLQHLGGTTTRATTSRRTRFQLNPDRPRAPYRLP